MLLTFHLPSLVKVCLVVLIPVGSREMPELKTLSIIYRLTVIVLLWSCTVRCTPCDSNRTLEWKNDPTTHNVTWLTSTICSNVQECGLDSHSDVNISQVCPLFIQDGDSVHFTNINDSIITAQGYHLSKSTIVFCTPHEK